MAHRPDRAPHLGTATHCTRMNSNRDADDEILETIDAALDTALQGDRREAENVLLDLFVHGPSTKRGRNR